MEVDDQLLATPVVSIV